MSEASTFRFRISVPRQVEVSGHLMDREDFFAWLWEVLEEDGICGVHEGTLLTPEAAEQGLETESWTVDAGEAPRDRDWVAHQKDARAEVYFTSFKGAERGAKRLRELTGLHPDAVEEQKPQDWDAQWKASFSGASVPPFWRILPPWVDAATVPSTEKILRINPGAGFGTGTHETTQLCLQFIAESDLRAKLQGEPVLDFGSGSGILAIGAALLGARVDAVEIDPLAVDNALENARLNGVEGSVRYALRLEELGEPREYRMVIANILRPVLIQFSSDLVARMQKRGGTVILSGLIEGDIPEVSETYSKLLGSNPRILALNEWRGLCWDH